MFLSNLNYKKEFYYLDSLDKGKQIVKYYANMVDSGIEKFVNINKILQNKIMNQKGNYY